MTRPNQHPRSFRHDVTDDQLDAAQVPAPRFEWAKAPVRPLAGVSHADLSDFETMEIPRIVD